MKQILKSYTFRWWQLALYEFALLSLGLSIGAYWPGTFAPAAPYLLLVFVLVAPYILYLYLSQVTESEEAPDSTDEPDGV